MPPRGRAKGSPRSRKRILVFRALMGETQDMPSESQISYSKEFVCWDAAPLGETGGNMIVTTDGYQMMTFVPCQSNPDGQGEGGQAGKASIMAYTLPGIAGIVFGVVCNGGGNEFDLEAGRFMAVHQSAFQQPMISQGTFD